MTTTRTMPFPPAGDERQLVFTSSQAARYLGVSLATIRRWGEAHQPARMRPEIPALGVRRFRLGQLTAARSRGSGSDRSFVERVTAPRAIRSAGLDVLVASRVGRWALR